MSTPGQGAPVRAAGAAGTFWLVWQSAFVRGLAAFVVKRGKATAAAFAVERLKDKVCVDEKVRAVLPASCALLENSDPFGAPPSWRALRDAVMADLRDLPEAGVLYILENDPNHTSKWIDAANVLATIVRLMAQFRDGDDVMATMAGLRDHVARIDTNWRAKPGLSGPYAMGTLVQIFRHDLTGKDAKQAIGR